MAMELASEYKIRGDFTCNLKNLKFHGVKTFRFRNAKAMKLPLKLSSISFIPLPPLHFKIDRIEDLKGINQDLKATRGLTWLLYRKSELSCRVAVRMANRVGSPDYSHVS